MTRDTPCSRITGVVLAGGASSRLGRNKAALAFGEPPVSLLARAVALLRRVTPDVVVSGAEFGAESGLEHGPARVRSLPDDAPGTGPVGAITTALRHTGTACLVLACDMPFMDAETLRALLLARENRPEAALVTAFAHPGAARSNRPGRSGGREYLAAVYEQGALRYLEPRLRHNLLKIALIIPEELSWFAPAPERVPDVFFNINRPGDLELAERYLGPLRNG